MPSTSELVAASAQSYAIASFGMMVEGWLLVVPRTHVTSTAEMDDRDWAHLDQMTEKARELVTSTYGVEPVIFEHGAAGTGRQAGCGVDHAHLHVVPLELDLRSLLHASEEVRDDDWLPVTERPPARAGLDYLWITDRTGSWVQYSEDQGSQVIRRALARELDVATWDWKQDLREDLVRKTVDRLAPRSASLAS